MPFCIALINLAVALMRSPQHKTFRILNVSVKISPGVWAVVTVV